MTQHAYRAAVTGGELAKDPEWVQELKRDLVQALLQVENLRRENKELRNTVISMATALAATRRMHDSQQELSSQLRLAGSMPHGEEAFKELLLRQWGEKGWPVND